MLERLGKYEVKGVLGKGATGTVYRAADPFGQRDVALKVMQELSPSPEEGESSCASFRTRRRSPGSCAIPTS